MARPVRKARETQSAYTARSDFKVRILFGPLRRVCVAAGIFMLMKRCFSYLLMVSLALPTWAATGEVKGRVLNKTTGRGEANVSVRLVKPGESGADKQIASTKTGPQGQFSFGPFQAGSEDIYMAQTQWQGFPYETVAFDGTGHLKEMGIVVDPAKVEVAVFNTTRQAPALFLRAHHMALAVQDKSIKVTERIVVENPANETFIGDQSGATVKLNIPPNAKDVALDAKVAGKLIKTADGYAVAKPILPVVSQRRNALILTYTLDWPSSAPWNRKIDLSHKVLYPTNFFFVVRNPDDKALQLTAPQLGKDETQEIPGADGKAAPKLVNAMGFPMAEKPILKPGETVSVTLGRPMNPLVWAFVMFVGALIAIVPLALRGGKRRDSQGENDALKIKEPGVSGGVLGETFRSPASDGSAVAMSGATEEIVFAIARLDEEFAQGAVSKDAYQKRRAAMKKQLTDLLS